ncbi:MAG: tRNA (adenosine(37)-N6)-threonylcarbamoyltransferase complex ATPase subunit type 1 TsaE [Candidatus Liptonbacteria bacterium]|nr:tRNA (adenosine(37)-N6)-threonylcarbamoyltransferase complex ATPase subunit type 1 TsaE [Candidatus Liptonbacteria bacterium]
MKRDNAIPVSRSSRATQFAARKLAKNLLRTSRKRKGAAIIALQGELGAGKTTFAQGFLRALGVKGRVVSPTFIFVRRYVLPRNRAGFRHAYHFDLYRVRRAEDLRRVGFYEALRDPKAIVLVEWPERAGRAAPRDAVRVHLKHGRDERERNIRLTP